MSWYVKMRMRVFVHNSSQSFSNTKGVGGVQTIEPQQPRVNDMIINSFRN